MEILINILVDVIVYYLFSYPGAAVRWIFIRKRKSFKEIVSEDIFMNSTIGLLFLVPVVGGIILILKSGG